MTSVPKKKIFHFQPPGSEDQRDNYLVYAIAREVMRSASNTYAMDRATCGICVSGGPGGADDDE